MSNIVKYIFDGRLASDPQTRTYGDGDILVSFSVASSIGWGDNEKTVYHNCTAFKHSAKYIAEHFKKGDGIFIEGEPTQNKKDDKVYYGVRVINFSHGAKKQGQASTGSKPQTQEENPFNDDDIPF